MISTERFSAEEINLMCIYGTGSRETLISDLIEARGDVYEPDMVEVFDSAIEKLETITDGEFADIGFYIADDDPDEDIDE